MIRDIVFDLGGVLVDWNPKYVYRKVFQTEEAVDFFLNNICTFHWNEQQDGGRTIAEAERILISDHPEYEREIKIYYDQWEYMLGGSINDSVEILKTLKPKYNGHLFALTNWSAETFPKAKQIFDFLSWFDGILVSGEEMMKKPDKAIFDLLISRYHLIPNQTIFIDDNINNIKAAENVGMVAIHFRSSDQLKSDLIDMNIW